METIYQGEAKTLVFNESNEEDLSSASLSLAISGTSITKDDDDFIDDDEASGIAAVILTAAESASMEPKKYIMYLTVTFSANNIDISRHTLEVLAGA